MNSIEKISALGTLLSRKYGKDMFRLLRVYNDISASEASSRLGLHVQTIQEFLETTVQLGLTEKKEVIEKKRPYYRYALVKDQLTLDFNIDALFGKDEIPGETGRKLQIREKKNSNSHFSVARSGNFFSTVSIVVGTGRERTQKKINLTNAQGKFLYHLPFPDARPMTMDEIMKEAEVNEANRPEIESIVLELIGLNVIEEIT